MRVLAAAAVALLLGSASARADDPDLLQKTDEIAREVSRIRGLRIERPIKRGVMTPDQLRERVLAIIHADIPPARLAGTGLMMRRLGLIAPDQDYLTVFLGFLTEQLRGFYDHQAHELYLAERADDEETLAHEINHALQDQHFALRPWIEIENTNSDAGLARRALGEGDAMALMIEYSMRLDEPASIWADDAAVEGMVTRMRGALTAMAGHVPLVMREASAFMYVNGLEFVARARRTGSWRAIDAMYPRPPLSTEHIVHPEKYDAYEPPVEVVPTLPATLRGYHVALDDVRGEFGLWATLVQHGVDEAVARQAVAGWGGDRMILYTPPGYAGVLETAVIVHHTVWDSEADALELQRALVSALPVIAGGARSDDGRGAVAYRTREGAIAAVERRGDAVLLIVGAPPARADELRHQIWKTWTVRRR